MSTCPKCHRPFNEGNSPNAQECNETDDDEGLCEAYAKVHQLHAQHAETVRLLEKLQDLLNAMPDSRTGTDCDIWKLWTDACNLVRDHLANLKGTQ